MGAPFFDIEDEYFVKADLWLTSSVAITLMDFFFGVAGQVAGGGHGVMEFRPDFQRNSSWAWPPRIRPFIRK